jgi:LysR substrate binding domain
LCIPVYRAPLLHDSATEGDGSGSDWRSWLKHVGRHDAPCDKGQRFSGAGLLIDAPVLGLGTALVRASLVSDHVANGTLICPLGPAAPTAFAYYLLCLPEAAALQNIVCFRDWWQAEADAFTKTCRVQCKSAPCPGPYHISAHSSSRTIKARALSCCRSAPQEQPKDQRLRGARRSDKRDDKHCRLRR